MSPAVFFIDTLYSLDLLDLRERASPHLALSRYGDGQGFAYQLRGEPFPFGPSMLIAADNVSHSALQT